LKTVLSFKINATIHREGKKKKLDDLKTTVEKLKREERELQRQYLNTLDLENKIQQELKDK